MDSNITSEQSFSGDLLLGEPHFDEEATLLSAQPVVPLEEIKAEQRFGRRLGFGIAIISSLILGALGAKLIYSSNGTGQTPALVSDTARGGAAAIDEPIQVPSIVEGAAGASTQIAPHAATPNTTKSTPRTAANDAVTKKEVRRRQPALQATSDSELPQRERFDRWSHDQEPRREERRGWRHRQRRSADGLLRVREIFEGPSRP